MIIMPPRFIVRPPRFADDWIPYHKAALSHLEDDDDDDDDNVTTQPMLITDRETTTQKMGLEFVTIPGRDARPLGTVGPVAGVILFLLIISLTAGVMWLRRKRQRQSITDNLDKVPLSTTTAAEGYCPYNVDTDGMQAGAYAKLDQPNGRKFPNVRFNQGRPVDRAARSDKARSLCDYDDPRLPQLYAVSANAKKFKGQRPRSCLVGTGDYDEPEFLIPLGGSARGTTQSTVVVNEGAREHTVIAAEMAPPKADEIYYSSVKDLEATTPSVDGEAAATGDERTPRSDGVYYSSINLKEQSATLQACNSASLPLVTRPHQDDLVNNQKPGDESERPHYFTLDREDGNNNGGKNMSTRGSKVTYDRQDDEEEPFTYDYLHQVDSGKKPAAVLSTRENARNDDLESMGYLKLAESLSGGPVKTSTIVAPSCAPVVPGEKSAGNEVVGTECRGSNSIYNTLQRSKLQNTSLQCDSNEMYDVILLD